MTPDRPNILLITDDQHRWDFYTSQAVPALRTPNLERLRREGVTFTNAFSNCPICMPTRMTWCHGLYASQVAQGLLHNAHDWPTDLPGMPAALRDSGYRTALVGKLHALEGLYPRDLLAYEEETRGRGYQDVFEVSGKQLLYWYRCHWSEHLRATGLLETMKKELEETLWCFHKQETGKPSPLAPADTADGFIGCHARQWLERYTADAPFFLHASFCGPHPPYDPPAEYASRYRAEEMPAPEACNDPETIRLAQRLRASYCAMIEHLDDEIGRLLNLLDARGLTEKTLVLFATDHGDMMGHHGRFSKGPAYDTSTRTPYLIRWPGRIPAGQVRTDLVEAVDLPATILDAAALGDAPAVHLPGSPGRSFLACARGEKPHRDWAYSEFHSWRMIRERDWKYVWQPKEGDLLFDMKNDPWEQCNRIDDPACATHRDRLRDRLLQSIIAAPAPNRDPHHAESE